MKLKLKFYSFVLFCWEMEKGYFNVNEKNNFQKKL